jgi:cytochrome c oxidase cbb3-type subunit III
VTSTVAWIVAIISLINIAALVVLLWCLRRNRGEPSTTTDTTGHVWDGDLQELNNPLPRWWLWLFLITVIFGLIYLVLYPGLGNYAGTKKWSQIEQYRRQSEQAEALLARTFAPFERAGIEQLARDPAALRVGRNLFLNNCATCHGSDGRGAPGFPNLTDHDWLWGGNAEAIAHSISSGRTGVMPAWKQALGGDSGVEDMVAYVLSLSGRRVPAGNAELGREKFGQICVGCHGVDGKGNQLLGAPNLSDSIWLNGGAIATIRTTIAEGRQGQMPAHAERLGETRVKLLAAYVASLGGADLPAPLQAAASAPASAGAAHVLKHE